MASGDWNAYEVYGYDATQNGNIRRRIVREWSVKIGTRVMYIYDEYV